MVSIKKSSEDNKIEPMNSLIVDGTIVPGLYGSEVDIKKSYKNMRRIGSYNINYLIFNSIKPQKSIENNYDKYIVSGNSNKNMVSLIFIVNDNDNLNKIIEILEKKQIKGNFFVDGNWFEKNNELVLDLIGKDHVIGNLSYNLDYSDSGFIWMNTILKKIGKQRINYCYAEDFNDDTIKNCSIQKNRTIKPSIVVKKNPTIEIKNNIKAGSIISLPVNSTVENELSYIIDYINSKGYAIENLNVHLSEKR